MTSNKPGGGEISPSSCSYLPSKKREDADGAQYQELENLIIRWLLDLPPIDRNRPKLLPPQKTCTPTLVLDLDQTLLYSSSQEVHSCQGAAQIFLYGEAVWINPRPGLDNFLKKCRTWYDEIILWTAAKMNYATIAVTELGIQEYFDHFLFNTHCYAKALRDIIPPQLLSPDADLESECLSQTLFLKPLSLLNRKHCYLVDDSREMIALNSYKQVIQIRPFTGDCNDRELVKLLPTLQNLSKLRADFSETQEEVKDSRET